MVAPTFNVAVKTIVALTVLSHLSSALSPEGTNIRWWLFKHDETKLEQNGGSILYVTCHGVFKTLAEVKRDVRVNAICDNEENNPAGSIRVAHRLGHNRTVLFNYNPKETKVKWVIYNLTKVLDASETSEYSYEDIKIEENEFHMMCNFSRRYYMDGVIHFDDGIFNATVHSENATFVKYANPKCVDSRKEKPVRYDIFTKVKNKNNKNEVKKYSLKDYYTEDYDLHGVENGHFFFSLSTTLDGVGGKQNIRQKLYFYTNRSNWDETPNLGNVKLIFRNDKNELAVPLFYFPKHDFQTGLTEKLKPVDPCKIRHPLHELTPFISGSVVAFVLTVVVLLVVGYLCLRVIPLAKAKIQKRGDSAVTIGQTTMQEAMGDEFSAISGSEEGLQKTQSISFDETNTTGGSSEGSKKKNSKGSKNSTKNSKKTSKKDSKKYSKKDSKKKSKGTKQTSNSTEDASKKNSKKSKDKSQKNSKKSSKKSGDKAKSKDKKKDGLKDY